jgi:hypothetical protein
MTPERRDLDKMCDTMRYWMAWIRERNGTTPTKLYLDLEWYAAIIAATGQPVHGMVPLFWGVEVYPR